MHFIFSESVPCEAGCESAISPTIYVVKLIFANIFQNLNEDKWTKRWRLCSEEKKLPATTIRSMTLTKAWMNLKRVDKNVPNLRNRSFLIFCRSENYFFILNYREWHPRNRSVQSVLNVTMTKINVLGCWVVDTASARAAWKGYSMVTPLIVPNAEIQSHLLLGSMACQRILHYWTSWTKRHPNNTFCQIPEKRGLC